MGQDNKKARIWLVGSFIGQKIFLTDFHTVLLICACGKKTGKAYVTHCDTKCRNVLNLQMFSL